MNHKLFVSAAHYNRCGVFLSIFISLFGSVNEAWSDSLQSEAAAFGLFGRPGLIDMPTSAPASDGTFAFTYSYADSFTRNSIFFQYAPWGSIALRYGGNGSVGQDGVRPNYDRSLDLGFNLVSERRALPSVTIGVQDVIGTGIYSGEYVVAGKTLLGGRLTLDAGLGWGRLASHGAFSNPFKQIFNDFENRPPRDVGLGGRPYPQEWFKGDAAPFFGLAVKATDNLIIKAEYSSDDYSKRRFAGTLTSVTPVNLGVQYAFSPGVLGHLNYLQGTELAFGVTFHTNVRQSATAAARTPAPPFVFTGESKWTPEEYLSAGEAKNRLDEVFDRQGIRIVAFDVQGNVARVVFENLSFSAPAQAFGRLARWLTFILPPEISTYQLTAVRSGMPLATVTMLRNDLAAAEHDLFGPEKLEEKSQIESPAHNLPQADYPEKFPLVGWGLAPYAQLTLFDPDEPRRADAGVQFNVHMTNGYGLEFGSSLKKRLAGNRKFGRRSDSVLPRVRSNQILYDQTDDLIITDLYLAKYGKLSSDIYSRATLGYLEQMYAGLSFEALWAPFSSPWSFGVDANYVFQRDYSGGFGLLDYETFTGHLTTQYTTSKGAYVQVSAGQYLAGDKGATFTLGRTFKNGWDLSAYATLTDVPFKTFGEGSFDKGIRLEIPIAALFGMESRTKSRIGIRSINRDGGARLEVPGRLMEMTEGYRRRDIQASWSKVLR